MKTGLVPAVKLAEFPFTIYTLHQEGDEGRHERGPGGGARALGAELRPRRVVAAARPDPGRQQLVRDAGSYGVSIVQRGYGHLYAQAEVC